MGVPKFYRWISERYPCLSEVVNKDEIPEFDNLYLDMNGIIHACSHPNDGDAHFRISEDQIYEDIFHYIEVLFTMIRPTKLFFMAVDGVAPRAKMNQQRGRRFRSAKEAQEQERKAIDRGEKLPTEDRFDSNCITPGTPFMQRLQGQLKYFVHSKISTDENWQNIEVILSGHETPGEGEHKIMDYIRYARSQPGYNPNTRHCLYGLDADLIMLALVTHEPHFALLREEVKFTRQQRSHGSKRASAETTTFHLLHISLLREYIECEFEDAKCNIDLDKVIDDWVLMAFLVGNDFIPNLPNLHINQDALPTLYSIYKSVLPTLNGYINNGGTLNIDNFEAFMRALSKVDFDSFDENYEDLKWLNDKSNGNAEAAEIKQFVPFTDFEKNENVSSFSKLEGLDFSDDSASEEDEGDEELPKSAELRAMIQRDNPSPDNPDDFTLGDKTTAQACIIDQDDFPETFDRMMKFEFIQNKIHYYQEKIRTKRVDRQFLHKQAVEYVTAIQWNLHYYYNGVCSWSWYYPQHYAPFISDIRDFQSIEFDFDYARPFLPYEQLMAVLPPLSKKHVPLPLQELMTSPSSPIIHFYPPDFKTDLNGKQNDWEAVVLIPFIDERRLVEAMTPILKGVSKVDLKGNVHSEHLSYTTVPPDQIDPSSFYRSEVNRLAFPDIKPNLARCQILPIELFRMRDDDIIKGLLPSVNLEVYFQGFPTLKHLKYNHSLDMASVKVFQMPSKNASMIVHLHNDRNQIIPEPDQEVHVGWPHLRLAKVESILMKSELQDEEKLKALKKDATDVKRHYMARWGVDIGPVECLVYVTKMTAKQVVVNDADSSVEIVKVWSDRSEPFAMQTVIPSLSEFDSKRLKYQTATDLFPVGSRVLITKRNQWFGCLASIMDSEQMENKMKVLVDLEREPNFDHVKAKKEKIELYYFTAYELSHRLGITDFIISRISGTIYMDQRESEPTSTENGGGNNPNKEKQYQRYENVGLNLKLTKRNQEVADYTRRTPEGNWLYSNKVYHILLDYLNQFPEIFAALHYQQRGAENLLYAEEVFFEYTDPKLKFDELKVFLRSLPSHGKEKQNVGSNILDERLIVAIEQQLAKTGDSSRPVKVRFRPSELYRPMFYDGSSAFDKHATFELFDRVVHCRHGYNIPFGLRGTVIAIYERQEGNKDPVQVDVLFDKPFSGGLKLRCSSPSAFRLAVSALLNMTSVIRVNKQAKPELRVSNNHQPRQHEQQPQHHHNHHHPSSIHAMTNRISSSEAERRNDFWNQFAEPAKSSKAVTSQSRHQQQQQQPPEAQAAAADEFQNFFKNLSIKNSNTQQQNSVESYHAVEIPEIGVTRRAAEGKPISYMEFNNSDHRGQNNSNKKHHNNRNERHENSSAQNRQPTTPGKSILNELFPDDNYRSPRQAPSNDSVQAELKSLLQLNDTNMAPRHHQQHHPAYTAPPPIPPPNFQMYNPRLRQPPLQMPVPTYGRPPMMNHGNLPPHWSSPPPMPMFEPPFSAFRSPGPPPPPMPPHIMAQHRNDVTPEKEVQKVNTEQVKSTPSHRLFEPLQVTRGKQRTLSGTNQEVSDNVEEESKVEVVEVPIGNVNGAAAVPNSTGEVTPKQENVQSRKNTKNRRSRLAFKLNAD